MKIVYRKIFNDYIASYKINKNSGKIVKVAGATRIQAVKKLINNYIK